MKTKLIPFDIEKVKDGAKVITRCGYPAMVMICSDKTYPVRAIVKTEEGYFTYSFTVAGKFWISENESESDLDLFIEEEEKEKPRREYSGADSIYVPKDDEGIREELIDAINGLWDNDALPMPLSLKRKTAWITWLEKQGEENSTDNKPKFQVGDWVIDKQGMVQQITDVRENIIKHTYEYNTISYSFGILSYGYFNENVKGMRRWTIQEAKPGDVLAIDWKGNEHGYDWQKIVIFKSLNEFGVEGYGNTFKNNELAFEDEVPFYSKTWSRFLHPATKEQRDILFQKIKEEGYEWDSDKKELKKIKEVNERRMTNQELSWWLREHPEEHREYMYKDSNRVLPGDYYYLDDIANKEVNDVYIRRNGGEWQEPLIEE